MDGRRSNSVTPRSHLLSNSSYAVMITDAGSGYSQWRDRFITRWREDVTSDACGNYIFLREMHSGLTWSAGYQPTRAEADTYAVMFGEQQAQIVRRDGTLQTTTTITVAAHDDVEIRHVSISNLGNAPCEIEVTSYAELVLDRGATDAAHLTYSKMFVQTEFVRGVNVLLATRRCLSDQPGIWAAHLAVVNDNAQRIEFETDRARFIGRGRSVHKPISIHSGHPLSNTVGTVLDPIFSLRRRLRIEAGGTADVRFVTLASDTRAGALELANKYQTTTAINQSLLTPSNATNDLLHGALDQEEATLFQSLGNRLLYFDSTARGTVDALVRDPRGPPILWAHGVSGDLPIVLLHINDVAQVSMIHQMLRARVYLRQKLLAADVVILNQVPAPHTEDFNTSVIAMIKSQEQQAQSSNSILRGKAYCLRSDQMPPDTAAVLAAVARVVMHGDGKGFSVQLGSSTPATYPTSSAVTQASSSSLASQKFNVEALEFFNGIGGFAAGGSEYVTVQSDDICTPAPWINIIANPVFGFQVSTDGGGYSWSINSQQNKITSWSNDPVCDAPSEVFYLRDDDSGELWGPTASPMRDPNAQYVATHGHGYSRFQNVSHEIAVELLQYVPLSDPIKISRVKIRNCSERKRRLSIIAYVEWTLGSQRAASAPFIATRMDQDTGAMLAQNPWRAEFGERVAFFDLAGHQSSWTGDRTEFLGRYGTLDRPAALVDASVLSNRVGSGFDPCGALQTSVGLNTGESIEIVVLLGEVPSSDDARLLVERYRGADLDKALSDVRTFWESVHHTVQVRTPDRAMDILLNQRLLYQTLACRLWGRTAFYQSSGAYGFRDQLQDVMALCVTKPALAREHLLRAAGRQFIEGDVQHWWLPPAGQGVRTRISDDRIWLAYVCAHYVEVTADVGILDATIAFLEGPALDPNQTDAFFRPTVSTRAATLFEHCALALDCSLALGRNGLPLIGTGDWNDGMNHVGRGGKGESVWLGWFLHAALSVFGRIAAERGDTAHVSKWQKHAAALAQSLEQTGWDGDWYKRGYYDDGTPLGSNTSSECRIDSIAQSWASISGAGNPSHVMRAMEAVDRLLVSRDEGLVRLFTPPFDHTPLDPGYIKTYPPGLRENGGQYTHGALWSIFAFAQLGDGEKATELFSIMNPINHSSTLVAIERYKVEPYVACADIYSTPPHVGRGGWTWYTGSAAWMYRAGLEAILGFHLHGATLTLDPCIPSTWRDFGIVLRYYSACYHIEVVNPRGVCRGVTSATLDSRALAGMSPTISLVDDCQHHHVAIELG